MPQVQALSDHCETAADVRRAADRVIQRRIAERAPVLRLEPSKPPSVLVIKPKAPRVTLASLALRGVVQGHFAMMPSFGPSPDEPKTYTIRDIQRAVCVACNITLEDLLSQRRDDGAVLPRHLAMMLCRMLTRRSLPEIGRRFGDRDHTTVMHAITKMGPVSEAIKEQVGQLPLNELIALSYDIYWRVKPKSPRRGRRVPTNM